MVNQVIFMLREEKQTRKLGMETDIQESKNYSWGKLWLDLVISWPYMTVLSYKDIAEKWSQKANRDRENLKSSFKCFLLLLFLSFWEWVL